MNHYSDSEFGRPPEEFPVLKEEDRPPVNEDYTMPREGPDAPEIGDPAPEYPVPGSAAAAQDETEKRRRHFRRRLMITRKQMQRWQKLNMWIVDNRD